MTLIRHWAHQAIDEVDSCNLELQMLKHRQEMAASDSSKGNQSNNQAVAKKSKVCLTLNDQLFSKVCLTLNDQLFSKVCFTLKRPTVFKGLFHIKRPTVFKGLFHIKRPTVFTCSNCSLVVLTLMELSPTLFFIFFPPHDITLTQAFNQAYFVLRNNLFLQLNGNTRHSESNNGYLVNFRFVS